MLLAARGLPVRRCEEAGAPFEHVSDEDLVAAHPALADLPRELLTPAGSVANKRSPGSTSPDSVKAQITRAHMRLDELGGA